MSNNLVERLRNWETVYPEDNGKPDGSLYLEAADALERAVDALDEAVYLLRPDEEDMMRQAGVYRIVTTLAILKGQTNA